MSAASETFKVYSKEDGSLLFTIVTPPGLPREEAVKAAKKMNYRFAIFKNVENPYSYEMPELVKWVFPKKK